MNRLDPDAMNPFLNPTKSLPALAALIVFCATLTGFAEEPQISLGELARRERERKRNSPQAARVLALDESMLNCQSDWDCLLAAVERRQEARMTFSERLDLSTAYGTIHSNEIHLEIREYGEETAVMKAWPENSRLQLSGRSRQMASESGLTPEQIESQERSFEKNIQKQDGLAVNCLFRLSRLEQFIRRIKQDQEDETAWRLAERCEGLDQTITNPYSSQPPQPKSVPDGKRAE